MQTGLKMFFPALLVLILWTSTFPLGAQEVIPPPPQKYFNDAANVVSREVAQQLDSKLENFERETSSQVVVAIFPRMQSDSSIEDYTQRVAQKWQVGQKGKNNGAVLFVFIQDRKMFIQVGYGLEGALPDALAKRIVEDEIKPFFQKGDYSGGVNAGVTAILQAIKGEYKGTGRIASDRNVGNRIGPFFILLILGLMLLSAFSSVFRRKGTVYSRRGRGIYSSPVFWGGGGGGWSGGGGGGGFSGGGGSFGGGGAGGSW